MHQIEISKNKNAGYRTVLKQLLDPFISIDSILSPAPFHSQIKQPGLSASARPDAAVTDTSLDTW